MSWFPFALLTILFYAVFDFFLKLSSSRMSDSFGGFIVNIAATLVLLVYGIFQYMQGKDILKTDSNGVLYAFLGGIAIGFGTITAIRMFQAGGALSISIPFFRVGTVVAASLIGIFILRERVQPVQFIAGFMLAATGLYLLVTAGR